MMWSSKENTTGRKESGNLRGRGSERAASFKPSQKKALSHPDWLGPISTKLLPLPHQVSVRCTQVDSGTSAQIKDRQQVLKTGTAAMLRVSQGASVSGVYAKLC